MLSIFTTQLLHISQPLLKPVFTVYHPFLFCLIILMIDIDKKLRLTITRGEQLH